MCTVLPIVAAAFSLLFVGLRQAGRMGVGSGRNGAVATPFPQWTV